MILTGRVITMDPGRPEAEAVGVRDGRIEAVGSADEVAAAMGGGEHVELGDAAVLPAFIDAHHHFCLAAFDRRTPDLHLPPGSSIDDVLRLVEQAAGEGGDGWVRLQGYDPAKLAEHRAPTADELDEVVPDRPLLLIAFSHHDGVLNHAGLRAMGWDDSSPDPPNGELVRRRGKLTGEVIEGPQFMAEAASRDSLLESSEDAWLEECEQHGRDLLAHGIARVGDAAVPPAFERLYERAAAEGRLPVTVHRMPVAAATVLEPRLDAQPTGTGDPAAPAGPAKLFMDGAERCAICFSMTEMAGVLAGTIKRTVTGAGLAALRASSRMKPARGADGLMHTGVLFWDQDDLSRAVATAAANGLQVAQHAIGNEAIDVALTALERSGAPLAELPGRPRLEHAMLLDASLTRRIADAGAVAVVQPYFIYDTVGDFAAVTPPPGDLETMPLRGLLDAGVTLAGSSDYPVSHYDVLEAVEAAVTRMSRGGHACEPEEAITVEEALRAYTTGSAIALGVEREAGSIEPGKRADLTVLSADPRASRDGVTVDRTYVAGELVFERTG